MSNKTYSVSEITYKIKTLLESETSLRGFVLKGEISNFVKHRTGHLYFNLKDESSQIKAIMFNGYANTLNFNPKDGDKVTVTGNLNVYVPGGTYSINVVKMENDGEGELYLKYLELKNKLKSLGWFDKPKREIPKFPKKIGVVTSPTGAVIEDIKNTVNRRYRLAQIILYPALVQGVNSSSSISKQINLANENSELDLLIVGRGGGSIEDLWGFNELETISAIYNSKIPVITAIGHETDDTLSDLVSDLRAPTPTAAAELATPNSNDLFSQILDNYYKISNSFKNKLNDNQNKLVHLTEKLEISSPSKKLLINFDKLNNLSEHLNNYYFNIVNNNKNKLNEFNIKLENLTPAKKLEENFKEINNIKVKLDNYYNNIVESNKNKFDKLSISANNSYKSLLTSKINEFTNLTSILNKVNPLAIMDRGFALVSNTNNLVIDSINKINVGDNLNLELKDGKAIVNVIERKLENGK